MTDPKIEAAAREAAESAYPPGTGRLGGKLFRGEKARGGFRERYWFEKGYLTGHASRDAEIATLRARLEAAESMVPRWCVADTGYPVKGTEFEKLYSLGWRVVQMKDHCPYHSLTRLCLMAPPVPLPEPEP